MSRPVDKKALDDLCYKIIGCAIEVHQLMGPGLLERAYQECLQHEFDLQNVRYISQCCIGLSYKESTLNTMYIADFLVEDQVIVEIKAVSDILPIHQAQLISYLNLSNKPTGLLINFHTLRLNDGVKRLFPGFPSPGQSTRV
ncbi:MAG: GxxExxY protein [Candidatus Cloacimonetes bacterium]|jgi:GxxExxY protein|nr:GxxExxY protein [Candidatus Cloacimonadota bacterium]MDY0337249.1 GxxExxY protein [Candidatus Cloacimonadaceae bacterium]MCB5268505.1 GxxExxY protein [Candidatus Cloacimonadota bacterium]MCK9334290.1 GxxExxY protein [Candidatus Cloacimonadota bacterium]MDD2544298.1 GxxExxY protein [Candidatus Cloacimonadota bacterium]